MHIKGMKEHDVFVERSIGNIKECVKITCHYITYRKYTKLMKNL